METSLQKQFRDEGFVHLRGVITPAEIAAMREAGEKHFVQGRSHMFTDDLLRIPCLAALSFNPRIVAGIRQVFGEGYATWRKLPTPHESTQYFSVIARKW